MFTTKNLFTLFGKHVLLALSVVVVSAGVIMIVSDKIANIAAKTAENRHLATILSERASLLSSLKQEAEIIGQNGEVIRRAFIPSNNILEFIAILKSLALKNGVTQSLNFSSPTPDSSGATFPLATISYQGGVSSANVSIFINYLKDFEKLPYFTKIDSLNISSGNANWQNTSNISFRASVSAQTVE